jgi:hypothetical protein
MDILDQILNLSNAVFCFVVVILVFIQHKVISIYFKKITSSRVYKEILLPLGPIGTGGIMAALMKNYTWPTDFQTFWPRVCFGMTLGLLSAHLYKIVNGYIKKKEESIGIVDSGKDLLTK